MGRIGGNLMITGFERECTFEHFGGTTRRDPSRCPHCGRRGNVTDYTDVFWNDRLKASDTIYDCPTCKGEWIIPCGQTWSRV